MSEGAPPPIIADSVGPTSQALTPDLIEGILANFRAWLSQLPGADAAQEPLEENPPPDLHTLLGQMIALRHEVNLQTKASRAQQEQNTQALAELTRALELVENGQDAAEEQQARIRQEDLRSLLKVLVDVRDSLHLARREVSRVQSLLGPLLEQARTAPSPAPSSQLESAPWWAPWRKGVVANVPAEPIGIEETPSSPAAQAALRISELMESVVAGYGMGLQRLDGALRRAGLEPIVCVGQPFDPETMEVVGTVTSSDRPSGEVIEEVRPGYLWEARVFRFAQVTVARS